MANRPNRGRGEPEGTVRIVAVFILAILCAASISFIFEADADDEHDGIVTAAIVNDAASVRDIAVSAASDPGDGDGYHDGDVSKINALIEKGIPWEHDAPETWPDSEGTLSSEKGVHWNDASPKRITRMNVSGFGLTGHLYISDMTERISAQYLQGNAFTSIDSSGYTSITSMYVWDMLSKGLLQSVDVSGCTALRELNCSYNAITSLNVSGCTSLDYLFC